MCKAYFGLDRHNERDKSRDIITLKWSIINDYYKACTDNVIVEWFQHWRKHSIGQLLPSCLRMRDTAISMISNLLQQKIVTFHKPDREKHMLGELCVPR